MGVLSRRERGRLLGSQHGGLGMDLHFQDPEGGCGRGVGMNTGHEYSGGRAEEGAQGSARMGECPRREGTGAGLALLEVVEVAAGLPLQLGKRPPERFSSGLGGGGDLLGGCVLC